MLRASRSKCLFYQLHGHKYTGIGEMYEEASPRERLVPNHAELILSEMLRPYWKQLNQVMIP